MSGGPCNRCRLQINKASASGRDSEMVHSKPIWPPDLLIVSIGIPVVMVGDRLGCLSLVLL